MCPERTNARAPRRVAGTSDSRVSAAPSGAESFVGAGSGGFASLHDRGGGGDKGGWRRASRLISTTPPASKMHNRLGAPVVFNSEGLYYVNALKSGAKGGLCDGWKCV